MFISRVHPKTSSSEVCSKPLGFNSSDMLKKKALFKRLFF